MCKKQKQEKKNSHTLLDISLGMCPLRPGLRPLCYPLRTFGILRHARDKNHCRRHLGNLISIFIFLTKTTLGFPFNPYYEFPMAMPLAMKGVWVDSKMKCAIRLVYANLSTFHIILNIYYHKIPNIKTNLFWFLVVKWMHKESYKFVLLFWPDVICMGTESTFCEGNLSLHINVLSGAIISHEIE